MPTAAEEKIQWADRGWWLSVEFNRQERGRKGHARAVELLAGAHQRYDLILATGQTMARGIFRSAPRPTELAELVEAAAGWKETAVFACGHRLVGGQVRELAHMLACAAGPAPCRPGPDGPARGFLGCVRSRVALMGYRLAAVRGGGRFWFGFFRRTRTLTRKFTLDHERLRAALAPGRWCPRFPAETDGLLERLPPEIDLDRPLDSGLWVPAGSLLPFSRRYRMPPVLPHSADRYRRFMDFHVLGGGGPVAAGQAA